MEAKTEKAEEWKNVCSWKMGISDGGEIENPES